MLLPKFRHLRKNGFTLLETVTAVGMVGMFIAILIVVSSNVLGMLRTSKDNISASQTLQQRAEEIRMANWKQVTNAQWIATNILVDPTRSTEGLAETVETVVISPHPAKAGFTPGKIVRQNGAAAVVSSNPNLEFEHLIRVDLTLTWKGHPHKRNRARASSILIAKGSSIQ